MKNRNVKVRPKKHDYSPMRADPSRTLTLRRSMMNEVQTRFNGLKKAIIQLIVGENAFGLSTNARFGFTSTEQQLNQFSVWLSQQTGMRIIGLDNNLNDWWNRYIQRAYEQGNTRTFNDIKGNLGFYKKSKAKFLKSAFDNPGRPEAVKVLASRVLTELQGVTAAMAQNMMRELTDGLIQGKSTQDIAQAIVRVADTIGINRANTIARTEIVRAHAEGQLDAMEALGVEQLGVMVEWTVRPKGKAKGKSKKGNPSPCKLCAPMAGMKFTPKDARGLIPRHPNCVCAFVPDIDSEPTPKRQLKSAVSKSVKAERPNSSTREAADKSPWVGADII